MIVVIDNGAECSDHKVYFVEMTAKTLEALKDLFGEQPSDGDKFSVVFAAEAVEWFAGEPTTLAAVIEDMPDYHGGDCNFYEFDPDGVPCTCWRKPLKALVT
jgi:hypothetical protein